MSQTFIVITARAITTEAGSDVEYTSNLIEFNDRQDAIDSGYLLVCSDDFNIGVITDGVLTQYCWMDKVQELTAAELAEIAEAIGFEEIAPITRLTADFQNRIHTMCDDAGGVMVGALGLQHLLSELIRIQGESDELRQHLANANHQLDQAELAKNNLRASRIAQFRKRREAEKDRDGLRLLVGAPNPVLIPPHVYRECINTLTTTARKYGAAGQLRERLSYALSKYFHPDHPHTRNAIQLPTFWQDEDGDLCLSYDETVQAIESAGHRIKGK